MFTICIVNWVCENVLENLIVDTCICSLYELSLPPIASNDYQQVLLMFVKCNRS